MSDLDPELSAAEIAELAKLMTGHEGKSVAMSSNDLAQELLAWLKRGLTEGLVRGAQTALREVRKEIRRARSEAPNPESDDAIDACLAALQRIEALCRKHNE